MSSCTRRSRSRPYTPDPNADIADYLEQCRALDRRRRAEDRALFRDYLRASVTRASPILLDLAVGGFDLPGALARLAMPPRTWRSGRRAKGAWFARGAADRTVERIAPGFADRHSRIGVVLRDAGHPRGRLGLSVEYGCLNLEVGLGPHVLQTWGGEGELFIDGLLPDALAIGCVGRMVDTVVHADVLADRGYEILAITPVPAERVTRIEIRADAVSFAMPDPCGPPVTRRSAGRVRF